MKKYCIAGLDLIEAICDFIIAVFNFLFAPVALNNLSQDRQKTIIHIISKWAALKAMNIRINILKKEMNYDPSGTLIQGKMKSNVKI